MKAIALQYIYRDFTLFILHSWTICVKKRWIFQIVLSSYLFAREPHPQLICIKVFESFLFFTILQNIFWSLLSFEAIFLGKNVKIHQNNFRKNVTWHFGWPLPSPLWYLVTLSRTLPQECHILFEWPLWDWSRLPLAGLEKG